MAQEQQQAPRRSIYIKGRGWVPEESVDLSQAPPPGLGLTLPPMGEPTTPDELERAQAFRDTGGSILEIGSSFIPTGRAGLLGKFITPTLIDALSGAAAGTLTGEGAGKEALDNATLGTVGRLGGEALPWAGYTFGQAIGGKHKNILRDTGAFLRERARQWGEGRLGIPLGATGRIQGTRNVVNQALEAAERNNPATENIDNIILGAAPDLHQRTYTVSRPLDADRAIDNQLIDETLQMQGKYGKPDLNFREIGEQKRTWRKQGRPSIEREAKKGGIPLADVDEMVAEGIAQQFAKTYDALDNGTAGPLNNRLTDLYHMSGATPQMKHVGWVPALGGLAVRAGVGYGVGRSAQNLFGTDPQTTTILGLLAMGLAGPRGISTIGNASGVGLRAMPTAVRTVEGMDGAREGANVIWDELSDAFKSKREEDEKKKGVRRREPR